MYIPETLFPITVVEGKLVGEVMETVVFLVFLGKPVGRGIVDGITGVLKGPTIPFTTARTATESTSVPL